MEKKGLPSTAFSEGLHLLERQDEITRKSVW